MLKLTNLGEVAALSAFVNKTLQFDLRLHLYTNDTAISEVSTISSVTEATYPGYASVILAGPQWAVDGGSPAAPSVAAYQLVTFTSAAVVTPETVYGYYVTQEGIGELMWGEAFPAPQFIDDSGQRITIAPRLTAKDESD